MKTLAFLILITGVIILILTSYFLIRNEMVCDFRIKINHSLYNFIDAYLHTFESDEEFESHINEYNTLSERSRNILNKHTYDQMLYSFKPLKLKYWFSDDEIKLINKQLN